MDFHILWWWNILRFPFLGSLMLINILYNIIYLHIGLPHIVMLKYSQIFFSWFSDALMLINMTLQHRSETLNCPTQDINMFPCQRFKGFNFANVQIRNKSQNLILNMKAKPILFLYHILHRYFSFEYQAATLSWFKEITSWIIQT